MYKPNLITKGQSANSHTVLCVQKLCGKGEIIMVKKTKFKKIIVLLTALIMIFTVAAMSACNGRIYESDYFRYEVRRNNDGSWVNIVGLTELGRQQRVLVIPKEISGHRVVLLGSMRTDGGMPWGGSPRGYQWESDNLEKIFLPTSVIDIADEILTVAPKLKRTIVLHWQLELFNGGGNIDTFRIPIRVSRMAYEVATANQDNFIHGFSGVPANILFCLNYVTSINHGIHWIDDVDYGELIYFIPPNPTRIGYSFVGWYRESQGITRWNFETDRLPNELLDDNENAVFQETRLYARWERN